MNTYTVDMIVAVLVLGSLYVLSLFDWEGL